MSLSLHYMHSLTHHQFYPSVSQSLKLREQRERLEKWSFKVMPHGWQLLEMKGRRWFSAHRIFLVLSSVVWFLLDYHIHFYLWSLSKYIVEGLVLSFTLSCTFALFFFTRSWQRFLSFGIKFEENLHHHHFANKRHFK